MSTEFPDRLTPITPGVVDLGRLIYEQAFERYVELEYRRIARNAAAVAWWRSSTGVEAPVRIEAP